MAEKTTELWLKHLESCGQSAQQLSKSIASFESASSKLNDSIDKLNTFDKMLKEEKSIDSLQKSVAEIKTMLEFFEETMPTFKADVDATMDQVGTYRVSLQESMKLVDDIKPEISELAVLTKTITEVTEYLKTIRDAHLDDQIRELHGALQDFTNNSNHLTISMKNEVEAINDAKSEVRNATTEGVGKIEALIETQISKRIEYFSAKIELISRSVEASAQATKNFEAMADKIAVAQTNMHEGIESMLTTIYKDLPNVDEEIFDRIEAVILKNAQQNRNEIIQHIESALGKLADNGTHKSSSPESHQFRSASKGSVASPSRQANDTAKTLQQIIKDNNGKLPITVKQPSWGDDHYFIVEYIEGIYAKGKIYRGGEKKKGAASIREYKYILLDS